MGAIQQTSYDASAPEPASTPDHPAHHSDDPADPFAGQAELSAGALVAEVEARNPSLQAMIEAWRAAAERYPQMISLDDPMFGFMKGTHNGWMVEASQKIPWPGKRCLKGEIAAAEADAACQDVEDARLRLAEAAKMALADYYLARRELEVNASTLDLMKQFRSIAKVQYEANLATQQDVLQADVELADLEAREIGLARDDKVAAARINTLLHRVPEHPLPPPPREMAIPDALASGESLQAFALQRRPDLAAQAARIEAEEAAVALACKEVLPDLEIAAKYDAFMPEDMRAQVGMNLNVPLWRERRSAALREAAARARQRRAEYEDRVDQIRFEVQSSHDRLAQGQRVVQLYVKKILPAAEESTKAARANYVAGRLDFLRLIEAQRQLHAQRDKYYESIAEYHRRAAELERATGGPVPAASGRVGN